MTFDEKLAIALEETSNEQLERYSSGKTPRFSLSYKIWRERVISQATDPWRSGKSTVRRVRLMVLAVILASCALTGITAYGLGLSMGRYRIDYDSRWRSALHIDRAETDRTVIEQYYGLAETDEIRLANYTRLDNASLLLYPYDDFYIELHQYPIKNGEGFQVPTRGVADIIPVSIFAEEDGFYTLFSGEQNDFKEYTAIFWNYDGYLFLLAGTMNKDYAIKLAKTLKPIYFE